MTRGDSQKTGRALCWLLGFALAALTLPAMAQESATSEAPGDAVEAPEEPVAEPEALEEEATPPLLEERAELFARVAALLEKFDAMEPELASKTGEERMVLMGQVARLEGDILEVVDLLVANAEASREAGLDTSDLDEYFTRELPTITTYLTDLITRSQAHILEFAETREQLTPDAILPYEERFGEYNKRVDRHFEMLLAQAELLERVGLDPTPAREYMLAELPARADRIGGRVQLARDQIRTLEKRLKDNPDDATASLELAAARIKLDWTTTSLTDEARLLDTLDIPTAEYRQLLIRASGNLTEDILDTEVARGLLDEALAEITGWLKTNGATAVFRLLLFVLIVAAARLLGAGFARIVRLGLKASHLQTSDSLRNMVAAIASRTILLLGILFGLSQLGVQIGTLLAGIGIIGFAVGFALQDTLSNFASGAMLLVYRPFDAGDVIETGGVLGTVDRLSLVNTTLMTFDNRKIMIPNNKIWGGVITNITAMDIRRVDLEIGVAHSEKVAHVETILTEVVKAQPLVLPEPQPLVKVHGLRDASVDFIVRPWVRREDYWELRWNLNRAIKERFEKEGVAFARPRPHVLVERAGEDDAS